MSQQVSNYTDIMNVQWEIYNRDTNSGKTASKLLANPQTNPPSGSSEEENLNQGMGGDLAASGVVLSSETPVGSAPQSGEVNSDQNQNSNTNTTGGTNNTAAPNGTTANPNTQESTGSNLNTNTASATGNTQMTGSVINDMGTAFNITSYVKNLILMQDTTAISTQANLGPQQVLSVFV